MFYKLIIALKEGYHLLGINKIVYFTANLFDKVDRQTIRIDGGLGAQIIGYMQYEFAKSEDPKTNCDISFFHHPKSHPMFKSDVTFRNWHLDYYGISLEELTRTDSKFKNFWVKSNLDDKGKQLEHFFKNGIEKYKWTNIFPISDETLSSLNEFGVNSDSKYSAIHVRRGDFLKFASIVVDDDRILHFLSVIKHLLHLKIFIVSDDDFESSLKDKINRVLLDCSIEYINGGDELTIHGLLRNASLLITSNSMFSLSAAILQKKGGVAMLPKQFFGKDLKFHNIAIDSLSKWMVLSEGRN